MKAARSSGVDMISDLPCDVLDNILGRLPLRDAMRTSILSKEWRYKWIRRPKLEFGNHDFKYFPQKPIPKTLIYQVLLIHEGPVLKFSLLDYWKSSPDIDHWIRFLTKKDVQEFTLEICLNDRYHLPSHLFTFQQLRHLKLSGCIFHPPTTFIEYKRLTHIDFHFVTLVPTILEDLFSRCPLLEWLKLCWCSDFESLEIDATNLRCFEFIGNVRRSICFKNTPKLGEVSVLSDLRALPDENPVCSNFIKFFHYMPNLQQLHVDGWVLQYLTMGGVPEYPPTALNNVKRLHISEMSYQNIEEVLGAVYLITRCPKLCNIYIEAQVVNVEEPVLQFIKAQANSYGGMKLLQTACMFQMYGDLVMEKEFLRFILSFAPALEEISIVNHGHPVDEVIQMIGEMKQFTRASYNIRFKLLDLRPDHDVTMLF